MENTGEIVVTIPLNGEVKIEVKGISGSGCKIATSSLEKAFGGEIISDTPTREMNQRGGESDNARSRSNG